MIIDTHVHYNLEPLLGDWQAHWQEAQKNGVSQSIIVGTNLATSQLAIELASQDPQLFATVGVHPHDAGQFSQEKLKQLAEDDQVVAIGEIGLDFFWLETDYLEEKEMQKSVFRQQIEIANQLNLPISIHVRDKGEQAYQETLKILQATPPKANFVLHCVSGPESYIKEMIELGAYFGFDGNITYKNADHLRNILGLLPPEKIVIETDAPYLPPVPHRGKTCEPWMIALTGQYLEENFKLSPAQLVANSHQLIPKLSHNQPGS